MYSVFLVEDEIVIRDGLKVSFPWEQFGFAYVGDAADGEMALPLIRQTKPDVILSVIGNNWRRHPVGADFVRYLLYGG